MSALVCIIRQVLFLSTPPSRVATINGGRNYIRWLRFYPRHPRGWRLLQQGFCIALGMFLSTPPSRVATSGGKFVSTRHGCFYPRHPRGWRRFRFGGRRRGQKGFYPRHPRGWRPSGGAVVPPLIIVSIHATLAGGDEFDAMETQRKRVFLSTPPSRVATSKVRSSRRSRWCFYPRHPRGWRQHARDRVFHRQFVSIHATLAGGDRRNAADH